MMNTLSVIALGLACLLLVETHHRNETLEGVLAVTNYELDECRTGETIYREALKETIDPKGRDFYTGLYREWRDNNMSTEEKP